MLSKLIQWFAAATLLFSVTAHAEFQAGQHYKVLPQPVTVPADGRVHVEEAFWYGCPHCFRLEDVITPWKKNLPADVQFSGVPAMFGRAWVAHAQLYHVADVLGVLEQMHTSIFRAINLERQPLLSRGDQRDFLVSKAGVSESDFDKAYESFAVKTRMKQADQRIRAFGINGVPALIVQGKYVVDSGSAGGMEAMLRVVDHLIAVERAALKGK